MMKHHKALFLLACCAVPFFAGCANLAPDYVQPPAPVAAQWPQELGVKASAARETAAAPAVALIVEWSVADKAPPRLLMPLPMEFTI